MAPRFGRRDRLDPFVGEELPGRSSSFSLSATISEPEAAQRGVQDHLQHVRVGDAGEARP